MQRASPRQASSSQTLPLFPAIVRVQQYGDGDLNERLYRRIKEFQADPEVQNSCLLRPIATVGGYQPELVLHEHLSGDPMWEEFLAAVVHPALQGYLGEHFRVAGWPVRGTAYSFNASWAVLYPKGAYQAPHLHRDVFCVLAYYPRVPERPKPEGAITFINPHPIAMSMGKNSWEYHRTFHPQNGTAIVFPGWLQHYSHPHYGDEERLLFTFDVRLVDPAG